MNRPVGVYLSAALLGIFAALQLLTAAILGFTGFTLRHGTFLPPASTEYPGNPTPPPTGLLLGFFIVAALILIAFAAWAIVTVVGLLRLRNWARYSVMVIGGCLAAFGLLNVIVTLITAVVIPATSTPPNVPAHMMQVILGINALFYLGVAGIGVWWLIYFNRHATKLLFRPSSSLSAVGPDAYLTAYPAHPIPNRTPGRFAHVPVPIIIIACLYLLASLCCALGTLLPFPGLIFGFILHRPATILLYLVLAGISVVIGIGLLRLDNRARLATYALITLGLLNFVVLLTPWGMERYAAYNRQIYASMTIPGLTIPQPAFPVQGMLWISAILCIAFYGVMIYFLQRSRQAFLAPPPPRLDRTP